jgi:hypothetical protein
MSDLGSGATGAKPPTDAVGDKSSGSAADVVSMDAPHPKTAFRRLDRWFRRLAERRWGPLSSWRISRWLRG